MDADTDLYMCIAAAIQDGPQGKSFEEVRIDNYLKAYTTTGHPPLPCPQIPTAPHERAALGLPPLFEPQRLPKQKPAELPDFHVWEQTRVSEENFQSIVAAPRYVGYSPEELRCQAYEKGNKVLPPSMASAFSFSSVSPTQTTVPSMQSTLPSIPSTLLPTLPLIQSTVAPIQSALLPDVNGEVFASITAQNTYSHHSFEELRVAYLLAGKEMTSTEIINASTAPVVPTRPALRLF
ncbi:uncharacterized protein EV420DRAFT_1644209 [Desarmillaria tabescens]|uniref:Uncharacterized protein n=1 Tax=Armillaria tabescens TaxID=1929756 RepID=A0AA39KC06_ARMTA|nr:uncharacterized protein EV420DRAFT_1644209 [Desarmillaria tabescens]KAK0457061.1 hypothetical protein EV420DRAFT_1644209 [Desarmillaria tabescens]